MGNTTVTKRVLSFEELRTCARLIAVAKGRIESGKNVHVCYAIDGALAVCTGVAPALMVRNMASYLKLWVMGSLSGVTYDRWRFRNGLSRAGTQLGRVLWLTWMYNQVVDEAREAGWQI